jgi:hypothetical protein
VAEEAFFLKPQVSDIHTDKPGYGNNHEAKDIDLPVLKLSTGEYGKRNPVPIEPKESADSSTDAASPDDILIKIDQRFLISVPEIRRNVMYTRRPIGLMIRKTAESVLRKL